MLTAPDYLQLIEEARVYDVAIKSPLEFAGKLSANTKNDVWLKREDLQPVFSFKLRGAFNRLARLTESEKTRGVICSSAGNHAQGVAMAASKLGTTAKIVMPVTTPTIKVDAVKALGGDVILFGDSFDAAQQHALALADVERRVLIHPFDDPHVIAGQGTIAIEMLEQMPQLPDAVFVPIGGGGLMAGIATWFKTHSPTTKVIGVEPKEAASMQAATAAGGPVTLDEVGVFADGVAVKRVGDETYRLCNAFVDEIVLVDTDETCGAIQELFEQTRSIAEPAGALAYAGLKKYVDQTETQGQQLIALVCGANMNFDRLRHVVERAGIGKHQEALLAVEIPESPGSFRHFCECIGDVSVTEFNYRYVESGAAHIFVGVATPNGPNAKETLLADLRSANYRVTDLSDNELAKLHIRHTVGGAPAGLTHERLLRFRFPERPGALLKFLRAVGDRWNISLFHYRNHGSDYGRVLAGIQVAPSEEGAFIEHLSSLGYPYWDETENPAYQLFLRGEPSA